MSGLRAAWQGFWHDFALERSRIAVLRFGLLGLLGWDLWTTFLQHAPRYGAGGFNVTQARWLDPIAPLPTPAIIGVAWLWCGFLAARAALGVATRGSTIAAAVIYSGVYLWNQADSYQHHYFICLLLVILALLPDDAPRSEDGRSVRHWTLRAFYVQLSFLYLWTAVTKTDPVWLSGATMEQIVAKPALRAEVLALGARFGLSPDNVFPVMAVSVMLGQYFAGVVVLVRRLWWLGLLVIPWFHLFVEFIEFDIEYFSYYMVAAILVLLSPGAVWRALEQTTARLRGRLGPALARLAGPSAPTPSLRLALALLTGAGAAAFAAGIRVEGTAWLAGLVGLAAALAIWTHRPGRSLVWASAVQVGLAGLMLFSVRATDAEFDYYRLWGGDLKRRGELSEAMERYAQANAVTAGPARHYQLGQLLERAGRLDEALAAFAEDRRRQEVALAAEQRAVHQATTDAERHFDQGERHQRLISRCEALAAALRRKGDAEAAAEADRCAARHRQDAADAFQAGLKFQPLSLRGQRGLRQTRGATTRR